MCVEWIIFFSYINDKQPHLWNTGLLAVLMLSQLIILYNKINIPRGIELQNKWFQGIHNNIHSVCIKQQRKWRFKAQKFRSTIILRVSIYGSVNNFDLNPNFVLKLFHGLRASVDLLFYVLNLTEAFVIGWAISIYHQI